MPEAVRKIGLALLVGALVLALFFLQGIGGDVAGFVAFIGLMAGAATVLLVLVGWVVFGLNAQQFVRVASWAGGSGSMPVTLPGEQARGSANPDFRPFWFSVTSLVPVAGIDDAAKWKLQPGWRLGNAYLQAHRIVGRVLITVFVAGFVVLLSKFRRR